MGIIKLNGTEYTSINVQDVLVGGSSVVDPVTKVANVTVPTKTSDLTNDSGFITDNDLIPTDESAVDEFTTINGGLLQECVVKLEPVQSGSGTPAPDNVRPISGHTEVDIDIADENHVTQKSYQIQIGQTVYGGTLDVVTGVMTVDRILTQITSSNVEYNSTNNRGLIRTNTLSLPSAINSLNTVNCVCDKFEPITGASGTTTGTGVYAHNQIIAICGYKTSLAEYQAWLTNNPVSVAYIIASPFTIQLTPQQISTLIGKNYLSAPLSGQSIDSIEYRDVFGFDDVEKATSVKVPISLLGTDEFTSTASKAYSAGDYFYKDGMMCKALTSIAKGATLTLNTNYSASTLADILKILSQ